MYSIILTVLSIVAIVGVGVRWVIKKYVEQIIAEIRPNGGNSIKDQMNRLDKTVADMQVRINEADHKRSVQSEKIDKMYIILLDYIAKR